MTESVAICQYLADRFGNGRLTVAVSDRAYGAYLNYLYYGERLQEKPAYQRSLLIEARAAREQGVSDIPSPVMQPTSSAS